MGSSIKKASHVLDVLDATSWELFEGVRKLGDHRETAAKAILQDVSAALEKDEHAVALGPALQDAQRRAVALLAEAPPQPPSPPTPPTPPTPPPTPPGTRVIEEGAQENLDAKAAQQVVQRLSGQLEEDDAARLDLTWRIHKKDGNR